MLTKIKSCAVVGLDCREIEVEVDISSGKADFFIVGLPDMSIQEAKQRIWSALRHSEIPFPFTKKIVINLAPADIRKEGTNFDLPMIVGVIFSSGRDMGFYFDEQFKDSLFVGELSLEGKLRHVKGVLPIAMFAKEKGFKELYVPAVNAPEASLVEGLTVIPVTDVSSLVAHLIGDKKIPPYELKVNFNFWQNNYSDYDMSYVKGQESVKRALEIAAAGAHNILMSGPPGSGKTLLARTLPSILPPLTNKEILELTKIYSVVGLLPTNQPVITERPFRAPHHTSSGAALVGGGKIPRPGEVTLAHRGILFLDEFPEFPRVVLENLRQPLEDGVISISRVQSTLTFPARFILVAAENPCPCGYASDPEKACICTPNQINNYQKKISGPLLDRIDLHVEVPRVKFEDLQKNNQAGECSTVIRDRVVKARKSQTTRFKESDFNTNAEMRSQDVQKFCELDSAGMELLKIAVRQMHLSARGYHRILKVARTIADLSNSENILTEHLAEALQYRKK